MNEANEDLIMSYIQFFKICLIASLVSIVASTVSINSIVPDEAFKFTGLTNYLGVINAAVSSAGDINGDGYTDFIIASSRDLTNAGVVYLIYGDSTGTLQSRFGSNFVAGVNIDPSIGFRIAGPLGFGSWVASAGDVDNDGYADILIGSPIESSNRGAVYVIYGDSTSNLQARFNTATPFTVSSSMPSAYGFRIFGKATGDKFGSCVASAGDIDGDDYADIIIGAPNENTNTGAAYVFYGAPKSVLLTRFGPSFTVGTNIALTTGIRLIRATGTLFGSSVSTAGDFNGDGFDDLLIGAKDEYGGRGTARIIYGASQPTLASRLGQNFDVTSGVLPLNIGFMLVGNIIFITNYKSGFGNSVASAGDINKDGYADIIVGSSAENTNKGAAYLIYGADSSTLSTRFGQAYTVKNSTLPEIGFRIIGPATTTFFGSSVSSAGDLNGDGYDDIMIGSPLENTNTGAVYILYGAPQATLNTRFVNTYTVSATALPSVSAKITGPTTNSYLGYAPIALAGDINNDGIKDLIFGARVDNTGKGAVYVVYDYYCPHILSNGNCVDVCPIKFFSNNGMCTACTTGCNLCTSTASTACLACTTGNLHQGSCVVNCPAGFFAKNKACIACQDGCSSCVAATEYTVSKCTACNPGFVLHNGDCIEECPCGLFDKNGVCEPCTSGCCSCNSRSSNECTQCSVNPLLDGSCVTPCPNDFFNDQGVCNPCPGTCTCPPECSSCSGTECTVCHPGFFLHKGACVESCPCGFFEDNDICSACTPGCCTCTSSDSNACTQCSTEYLFQGSCVFPCPQGHFSDKGDCAPCFAGCSTCTSAAAEACTSCSIGVLFNGSCVDNCPDHYTDVNGVCTA